MHKETGHNIASFLASRNIQAEMARHNPKLRAEDFAQKIGIARATLYTRFSGANPWSLEELIKAAHILGVDLETLLVGVDREERAA